MSGTGRRPNVILVLTDDQGFADLGCSGNPWVQTPHIDRFHDEAVRCTDFHVSPLCTPTRGALMTGHLPLRNGAWATCWGRSILKADEVTMADVFAAGGYRTGMFGKWHLGDNYPYRPQDRGFETVVAHKGGGVGQTPDYWGNNYFDDTYFHNGEPIAHSGYCTDVWFDEALHFVEEHRDGPFFAYIATNAPHHPYLVEERYEALYAGNADIPEPGFYGMITNIDENFGRLRAKLAELGLEDDTILIFMTDNGSSGGARLDREGFVRQGYNAGLRGMKGWYYDGGHKAPFFCRWPGGNLAGRDVTEMALHVDLLPTFIELCDLPQPAGVTFDGTSLAPLLRGEQQRLPGDRVTFAQYRQATELPEMWTNAVLTRQWRLVYGRELYDIQADPGQRHDVAAEHPEVVARLRGAHEAWWTEVLPRLEEYAPIALGHEAENPTVLNAMDVLGDVAWSQAMITMAQRSTGRWMVQVAHDGRYRFALRRWPAELALPIEAPLDEAAAMHIAPYQPVTQCGTLAPARASLALGDMEVGHEVPAGAAEVVFELDLTAGEAQPLEAWFHEADGQACGAYYVVVERL